MPEIYTIFARKNSFCPNLGGNCPPPPPPVSYAYVCLAYRRLRGDAIEVYKYLKGIYRVDASSMLPLAGLKTFETRGHLLKIQKRYCRTKLRANFFSFRIVNMWNGLPDDVVLSPTLNIFKGIIDRHWRSLRYSVF